MINLYSSCSLTEFQRNAKAHIDGLRETKDSLLLTVNGKVEAVLVNPDEFRKYEEAREREELIAAIRRSEKEYAEGKYVTLDELKKRIAEKYGV